MGGVLFSPSGWCRDACGLIYSIGVRLGMIDKLSQLKFAPII